MKLAIHLQGKREILLSTDYQGSILPNLPVSTWLYRQGVHCKWGTWRPSKGKKRLLEERKQH